MPYATYTYPGIERVVHGAGAVEALAGECERLEARRVLLMTTGSLVGGTGLAAVREALSGFEVTVISDSVQHAPIEAVSGLITEAAAAAPDAIVSFGGGSVIDSAKAVAAALAHGYDDAEQLYRHRIVFTLPDTVEQDVFTAAPIGHVTIPTTLSAAEHDGLFGMTRNATKDIYGDPRLAPATIVLDPELTAETPAELWAASGIRALDHAVEIYLSAAPSPLTDAGSLHAVRLLGEHLPRSARDPDDGEARLACLQAAWLSMFGVENVPLGLCHGIGHQIGARCGVPHGVTSCVMLPTVLEEMVDVTPRRMADLAVALDPSARGDDERALAASLPGRVRGFITGLGLPDRLSQVGVTEADFAQIAEDSVHDFVVSMAPIDVDAARVVGLLERAL